MTAHHIVLYFCCHVVVVSCAPEVRYTENELFKGEVTRLATCLLLDLSRFLSAYALAFYQLQVGNAFCEPIMISIC